ncbi:armadillo-type protein [Bisporella sp. PMI_857]|nr:armadillo-type protein [Bisporella sp. PMI_857]
MSAMTSTGSPTLRRSITCRGDSQENTYSDDKMCPRLDANSIKQSATALSTSKFCNQAPKKMKISHESASNSSNEASNPMDKLLAKLSEQTAALSKQHEALKSTEDVSYSRTIEYISSATSSVSDTPATAGTAATGPTTGTPSIAGDRTSEIDVDEVLRLKAELEAAKGKIARMDQELAQSRITKHTIDQAIGTVSEADFSMGHASEASGYTQQQVINSSGRPQYIRDNSWAGQQEDDNSDTSDALSASGFNRAKNIWSNNGGKPTFGSSQAIGAFQSSEAATSSHLINRGYTQPFDPQIQFPAPGINNDRFMPMPGDIMLPPIGPRRNTNGSRFSTRAPGSNVYASSNSSFEGFTPISTPYGSVGIGGSMSMNLPSGSAGNMSNGIPSAGYAGYQPQPIGTPLSPHAPEFTSSTGWKDNSVSKIADLSSALPLTGVQAVATEGQTYLPTTEPLNYRRLLDRTVNCNWKYIVDKIVCNNDQQASIFLQQKLKVGTSEQKYDIVEAIVAQAYPLMVNRFGNFLVQRCFEHGTPEQVIKIAEAIRGNTLNLSMDAFGCHVVQKAFDSVPEDYKAIMVHELLRRIPETVIHRYACHVWQKLFELRWTETPPQIMKYVNDALRGMWHEVALGETGSLVVQNIFENCLEEDKRPCIEEVLASIDIVAHGQFGNWCIQHICEHGAPADRSRAIDHVIRYASEYSMDQFASKVVEKCLKIGGVDFLGRYLDRVCEGRHDRPRIPLIDIASDQYGNYLIQYILTHSNPQHREIVAQHIRKHMVSLRGSKFGSRVGMLCTNPAIQTRPGPGAGTAIGPANPRLPPANPRYPGAYR